MTQLLFRVHEPGRPMRILALQEGLVFGRASSGPGVERRCDLQDPFLAERHAVVVSDAGALFLEELTASNHTRVLDGPTLSRGARYRLEEGVRFQIGGTRVEVTDSAPADARPSPPTTERARPREAEIPASKPGGDKASDTLPLVVEAKSAPADTGATLPEPADRAWRSDQPEGLRPATLATARPRLVVAEPAARRIVEMREPRLVIGREQTDCEILHPAVSKLHAAIIFNADDGRFLVQDLGSRNKTFLGGKRLPPDLPHPLPPGSYLRFGPIEALFLVDDVAEEPDGNSRDQAALDFLVADGSVSVHDADEARAEARSAPGRSVAECLLFRCASLTVKDWVQAVHRASPAGSPGADGDTVRHPGLVAALLGTLAIGALAFALWSLLR